MNAADGIRAIFFDLDGTLRHSQPAGHDVFWAYAASLGAPRDRESQLEAMRWAHRYWANSDMLQADEKTYGGREDSNTFWQNYALRHLKALGCPPKQAEQLAPLVHKHMAEDYQPEDWVPPEVPETLGALKEDGYALGVITNRRSSIKEYLIEIKLHPHFDFAVAAGEINAWKPEPEIFHHALAQVGVKPEEAVFIGDNYYSDVIGAERAGVHPVLIDPDEIFPEADCPIIENLSLDEIWGALPQRTN